MICLHNYLQIGVLQKELNQRYDAFLFHIGIDARFGSEGGAYVEELTCEANIGSLKVINK